MGRISDKWLHSQWCIDLSGVLWVVVHKPRDGRIVIKRVGMIESVGHNSKYQVHTSADGKPHMVEAEVYRVSCDGEQDIQFAMQRWKGLSVAKKDMAKNDSHLGFEGPHVRVMSAVISSSYALPKSLSKCLSYKSVL